jgi:hypothetical protein
MPHPPAKLVPPTVATCRWRHVRSDGMSAECGLVSSLTGIRIGGFSSVPGEACAACCRSFPPSARRLNPTVASLLYSAASRILDSGGMAGCDVEKAAQIQGLAERSLDLVHPRQFRVTPARAVRCCCWLGNALPSGDSAADCGEGRWMLEQTGRDGEPVRACRHPAHGQTTPSGCRMCRDWATHPQVSRFLSLEELIQPPDRRSGAPVRRWAFGVTTAPRRQSTLEPCLDGVVRAGWQEPRLFLDGSTPLPARYCRLPVTWREDCIGAWPAWYLALAELVLQQPDADAYVMLQDDVVLYDRDPVRLYLERVLWPGDRPGLVSLFYAGRDPTPGWHRSGGAWQWGAQGFVIPPGIARALLCDADVSRAWLAASADNHVPIPSVLWEWARRVGIDLWYASPSLSQHIGNTSAIWTVAAITGGRRAPWFSGSVETEFAVEESLADFPEDAFPCHEAVRDRYLRQVERGRQRMRGLSVVLCGLCRDARPYLPRTAARVERLGDMFRDYRVVVFENDSLDATKEFLSDWQSLNPHLDVMSESLGAPKYPRVRSLDRAAWMARCRNRCRERIVQQYADFDYVIVFDMDLPGGWSFDGVAHTFGEEDWDFVGSYGLEGPFERRPDEPPYSHFDVWAFRPARGTAARRLVNYNGLRLRRGDPLLTVESCFGGLGVYRTACLQSCEYGGTDCEHVVFHEGLRRAGFDRLFLNPSQIVLYSPP